MPEPGERPRPAANDFPVRIPRHHYALETIRSYLHLVLSAPCSGRSAAWILQWLTRWVPGWREAPCANAGRTWLFRLGLHELTCEKERADDWIWLVDHTVQLGSLKGMIVVGLRLSTWQPAPRPLTHADVRLLHVEPMEHSGGSRVQEELEKVVARTGVPRAIVSDGGSDLKCGVNRFRQAHPTVAHLYDVKHKMALLLKKELERDSSWEHYVSQSNLARHGLTLTPGAFLVPPGLSAKARYMNADRLITWGRRTLNYVDRPREMPGSPVDRELVEGRLGWLRKYRRRLREWSSLFALAQTSEHYVRHHGLHAQTVRELEPQLQRWATCPRSRRMKGAILEFLAHQAAAARPGERLIGSTEVLESIIGKYKRLQSMHRGGGMTGMILSIGAMVGQPCRERILEALQQVTGSKVWQWCRDHLGVPLQTQRKLALATEQIRDP